jgi:hypothetical protein
MWKEAVLTYFEVLSWNFLGGAEENYESLCEDSLSLAYIRIPNFSKSVLRYSKIKIAFILPAGIIRK